jgi:hypothetical protein
MLILERDIRDVFNLSFEREYTYNRLMARLFLKLKDNYSVLLNEASPDNFLKRLGDSIEENENELRESFELEDKNHV